MLLGDKDWAPRGFAAEPEARVPNDPIRPGRFIMIRSAFGSASLRKGNGVRRMQSALARVALIALATAMAVALVGCERVGGFGPVAIQAEGNHLVVTVCHRIDIGGIHMQARPNVWGKWTTFWTDSSSISLERGSSASTGGPALSDTEVKLAAGAELFVSRATGQLREERRSANIERIDAMRPVSVRDSARKETPRQPDGGVEAAVIVGGGTLADFLGGMF